MKSLLPAKVFDQHIVLLGKTRAGKSTVLRGSIGEPLLEAGEAVTIIDPKGDWWGIKLAKDGRGPGFPVVIFGGEHADVPLDPRAGAHVGELLATGNRPALIDMGGWMPGERTRFWIDFASAMFRHVKGRRWLLVDEVHNFAPKGKVLDVDAGKALHWTNRLASEGLGKGLHMAFASQRPQKVHNDTLTSAETLIALKVIHKADRDAVWDWIDGCGDRAVGKELLGTLAHLKRAEGWAWSPEAEFGPERIQFPMFKTYDSFRPQSVEDTKKLKGWASVDLEEVRSKLSTFVEQAKANDPKELRAEIAKLKILLEKSVHAAMNRPAIEVADPKAEEAAYQRGRDEGWAQAVAAVKPNWLAAVQRLQDLGQAVVLGAAEEMRGVDRFFMPPPMPIVWEGRRHDSALPAATRTITAPPRRPTGDVNGSLPRGEKACLIVIAQRQEGATREQLTVVTGYKRSSRDAYVQRLREKGYVEQSGDRVIATAEGIQALGGDYDPLPRGAALRDWHLQRLPEGERRILKALIEVYPKSVARDWIDQRTDYKRSSRDAYIQRLSARQLVSVERGEVRASDELF